MKSLEKLKAELNAIKSELKQRYKVETIAIFGRLYSICRCNDTLKRYFFKYSPEPIGSGIINRTYILKLEQL